MKRLIKLLVGDDTEYATGAERIRSVADAAKWRAADAHPRLDASVDSDGKVSLFWTEEED